MKRIKAACLEQTVHFMLKEELGHAAAAHAAREEFAAKESRAHRVKTMAPCSFILPMTAV